MLHTETMALRTAIHRLENMDDMVQLHADYVDRIVDRCLLGDKVRDESFFVLILSWRLI